MDIYQRRRAKILEELGKGVGIIRGAPEVIMSHDTHYPYRQDADLYYLTGYESAGAALILDPQNEEAAVTLFVQPQDPALEVWTGWRLSFEESREKYGVDRVLDIAEFETRAREAMQTSERVYVNLNHDTTHTHNMLDLMRQARARVQRTGGGPIGLTGIGELTYEARLHKDTHELDLMRQAADISADAHCRAMRAVKPGMYEYELQAILEGTFLARGCTGPAYGSIVGAGANATVLHYVTNRSRIAADDLVLIDAAGDYQYYAADITRTFPASGKFTGAAREIYEVVLAAQTRVVEAVHPGVTYQSLHELDIRLLTEGMVAIGLLQGDVDELIATGEFKKYFMHGTGHWLGIDVHDVGDYKLAGEDRPLEEGMVFTVEPGLYIAAHSDAPEHFRGIGVRIEDDVLVTADGHEVFTDDVPKSVTGIESLMEG